MTVKTLLSVDEYLETKFEDAEPDYVDGLVVERAMPDNSHSRVLTNLTLALAPWIERREIFVRGEIRLRVAPTRYRVADLACFTAPPRDEVPEAPPVMVCEVASPGDPIDEVLARFEDYERAGVAHLFFADPARNRLSRFQSGNLSIVPALEIPECTVAIPLDRIFAL